MSAQVETAKDMGTEASGVVTRWIREIDLASGHEKEWRDRSEKIVKRYRDDDRKAREGDLDINASRFNVLYANTEVLKGVMYQRTPVPDVRRRFLDKDPIARAVAQIEQRAISYMVDTYDFDDLMNAIVMDMLLPGRGVAMVKYVPTFGDELKDEAGQPVKGEDGKPLRQKVYEEVRCEYVEWDMYRQSPAKRWSKVRWVGFGELYTRDDLVKAFGDKGKACTLDWSPKDKDKDDDELFKRALVWQIWDKQSRKVYFVCKGYTDAPLLEVADPLNLEGFFPCPKPAYSITTTTSTIPVPEYFQYQDQAIELDTITERIDALVECLKFRGVRDASFPELEKLSSAGDGEFIPMENLAGFMEKGGIEKLMLSAPIAIIADVLMGLYDQRERVLQIIYQITGLSDIVRGASKASETATAQEIKGRYANVRIAPRQKEVARIARDLFRMKAEIICEKFDPTTLKLMTGEDLWVVERDVPDPMTGQVVKQKFDATNEIMALMRNEKLRGFRVDVETDSTVQPDASEEQKNRTELLQGIVTYLQGIAPAVQSGEIPKAFAVELLSWAMRSFKVSPQIEQALDSLAQDKPQGEDPKAGQQAIQQKGMQSQAAVADAQAAEATAKAQEAQAKARKADAEAKKAEFELSMLMQGGMVQPGMPA
jgi:hypothetical protein